VHGSKAKGKFAAAVGWIEWHTRYTRRHGKKSHSHLWTIGQYQGDPVMAAQAHGKQRLYYVIDVPI
jgi:hypothetical protein